MRGDRTFAYDLVMRLGAVSGRVVLLLRSTEAKPNSLLSVRIHSPTLVAAPVVLERGSQVLYQLLFSFAFHATG